jgi:hypothetical protein
MSAQTTPARDPRVQQAIDSLLAASKALNDLPDEGHAWEAKMAIAKAVDALVRIRGGVT